MTPPGLEYLLSRTNEYRSIKYDLRNMRILLERLGNPQSTFRCALIAGTNGKGSVAAFLSAMIPSAGIYTSPHLRRLNERIRIGAREISDGELTTAHAEVAEAAGPEGLLYPPTYFEMMTAIAFVYFRGRTDFALLEVGMGGRLDATNIVQQEVSVITSIGMDHQEFLGTTLEAIAREKAGIIKETEPVVLGPRVDAPLFREAAGVRLVETRDLPVQARALPEGCFEVDLQTPVRTYSGLRLGLAGRHQVDNAVTSIRAAECLALDEPQIALGVSRAGWPGRLQRIEGDPSFLLDGAHNEQAVQRLKEFLAEFYPRGLRIIFGCMADKDHATMMRLLRPHATGIIFTRAAGGRSMEPQELASAWPGSETAPSVAAAIALARDTSTGNATVLICGSLYIIGEALSVLEG